MAQVTTMLTAEWQAWMARGLDLLTCLTGAYATLCCCLAGVNGLLHRGEQRRLRPVDRPATERHERHRLAA